MQIPVNGYAITWSIAKKIGTLYLHFVNNQQVQIPVNSADEILALREIFHSSPTVVYEPDGEVLMGGVRPPG